MNFFGYKGGGGVKGINTYLLRGVLQNVTECHKGGGGGGVQKGPKIWHVFFEWPLRPILVYLPKIEQIKLNWSTFLFNII